MSEHQVRRGYGRGAVLPAALALRERMVDRIATLEATLARLGSGEALVRRGAGAATRRLSVAQARLLAARR